jgi:hypothetical protein
MKKLIVLILFLLILFLASGCQLAGNSPKVIVTDIPPADKAGILEGKVAGINPWQYEIFVFLHVSNGWWYKPYFGDHTYIRLIGTWNCDVATGGIDTTADQYAVYLVPRGTEIPLVGGADDLPEIPNAVDSVIVDRE